MTTRQRGFEIVSAYDENDMTLPRRATNHSAAYDIFAPEGAEIAPGEKAMIKTGVKVYMQSDEAFFIVTRSGIGSKKRITLANNVGVIDSDYYNNIKNEGEIIITLVNEGDEHFTIGKGNKIAQGFFQKILLTDDDTQPDATRKGGLGSSG